MQELGALNMHPVVKGSLIGSLIFQGLAIAVTFLVPFGFDHPSSLGLDFGHFLLLLFVYALALLVGVIVTGVYHRNSLAVGQIAVACLAVYIAFAVGI